MPITLVVWCNEYLPNSRYSVHQENTTGRGWYTVILCYWMNWYQRLQHYHQHSYRYLTSQFFGPDLNGQIEHVMIFVIDFVHYSLRRVQLICWVLVMASLVTQYNILCWPGVNYQPGYLAFGIEWSIVR